MLLLAAAWFFGILLAAFASYVVYGHRLLWKWQTRHIPGPPIAWLWGNIPEIHSMTAAKFHQHYAKKYGPVYKAWGFQGPEVVISSPELTRQMLLGNINRTTIPTVAVMQKNSEVLRDFRESQIIIARDEIWRSLREAWDPFFLPGSLESFAPTINELARTLVRRLDSAAKGGELVDVYKLMAEYTMDTITRLSFGVPLHVQDPENATGPFADNVRQLHKACETTAHGANATSWFIYTGLYPELLWLVRKLATWYPDPALQRYVAARDLIVDTVGRLLKMHREAQEEVEHPETVAEDGALPNGSTNGHANGHLPGKGSGLSGRSSGLHSSSSGLRPIGSGGLKSRSSGLSSKSSDVAQFLGRRPSDLVTKVSSGKRRGVQPGSFIDLLVRGTDRRTGKPFTDGQIICQGHVMIMAGFETTAITLTNAVYNLSQAPKVAALVAKEAFDQPADPTLDSVEDMTWADAVLRECLRLHPSAPVGGRDAGEDCVLGGYKIKKGTQLKSSFYAIHRDPELWDRPDDFVPARWVEGQPEYAGARLKEAWTAFGNGVRRCPGQRLAFEEAKVAMVHIFRRFKFELGPGQVPLKLRNNQTMSPADGVWVRVQRCK